MKIKTIFPLLISAVFVLAACDPSTSSTSSSTSSSSSSGTISTKIATFALPQQITESYKPAIATREDSTKLNTGFAFQEDRYFITENSSYKVGTDNPFKFLPAIDAYTDNFDIVPLTSYHSIAHVDISESAGFRELGPTEIDNFVSIDNVNSTFHFTEAAKGHTFKLRVLPDGEYYTFPNTVKELSFEVEIIEGYNVHNVAELSMIDNHNSLWNEYKTANNLPLDQKPKGIILHDDLKITKDDVPTGFFYTENDVVQARMPGIANYRAPETPDGVTNPQDYKKVIGSLKDFVSIYTHDTPKDETFVFEGNYFSIDASAFPHVRKFGDKTVDKSQESEGSHTQLFGLPGDGQGEMTRADGAATEDLDVAIPAGPDTEQGDVIMRNMTAIGNGGRENTGLSNGGVMFNKSAANVMTWENIIARNMTVSFFSRASIGVEKPVTSYINYCKSYDSYSTMTYYYGSQDNYVNNSILKRSGGALFISDETWVGDDSEGDYPNRHLSNLTTVNCELDGSAIGSEPWFESHGASSAVSQLKSMGPLFTGYQQAGVNTLGKNIVKNEKMNIIALLIRGSNVFDNNMTSLKSTISINESAFPLRPHNMETQTPYAPYISGAGQFLMFESENGGRGYFNGTNDFVIVNEAFQTVNFGSVFTQSDPNFMDPAYLQNIGNFFSGDTINLYLKPMPGSKSIGIVLGY